MGFNLEDGDHDDDKLLPAFLVELLPGQNEAYTHFLNVNKRVLILVVKIKAEEPTRTNDSSSNGSVLQSK